jgi:hypothetical protein
MSMYPTKFLLATDGSEESNLAAQATIEISKGARGSSLIPIKVMDGARRTPPVGDPPVGATEDLDRLLKDHPVGYA